MINNESGINRVLTVLEQAIEEKKMTADVASDVIRIIQRGQKKAEVFWTKVIQDVEERPWVFLIKVAASSLGIGMMLGSRFKNTASGG